MSEERRLVTILFADVSGSTALGESLDPEDLRALLTRYYAIARDVVAEYGGTIEKFIGDAVMAVFGLPTAHGDDAERALGAALDLRDRVRDDPRLGERLPIRLGVASGDIVARRDAAAGEDFLSPATRSTSPRGSSRAPTHGPSRSPTGRPGRRAASIRAARRTWTPRASHGPSGRARCWAADGPSGPACP